MKTNTSSLFQGLLLLLFLFPSFLVAQTFTLTVNTTDDNNDGSCTTAHCSYREALNAVNGFQGNVRIQFNIPGFGTQRRIEILETLPAMTIFLGSLEIDGTTQSGGAEVVIDGNGQIAFGLNLSAASNTVVTGLTFDNFASAGILVGADSDDCIIGNENGSNIFMNNRIGVAILGQRGVVKSNLFQNNELVGVYVVGDDASATIGELNNPDADNIFIGHERAAIEANDDVEFTNVFRNSFYCNTLGIQNFNGANNDIQPPTLSDVSVDRISGTAISGAYVQVYAKDNIQAVCSGDNPCQGNIFLGATVASQSGDWELTNFENPPRSTYEITATQTFRVVLGAGVFYAFTSEFAECISLCSPYEVTVNTVQPPCPGDQFRITLDISNPDPNAEPLNIRWSGPNGFGSSATSISGTVPGTYLLTATNSCTNIQERVVISAEETPPATIEATYNGPICEFEALQLFATTEKVDYEWTGPFGFSSNEQNPIVNGGANAVRSGQYFLSTKTPANGCPGPVDTVDVFIKRPPETKDTFLVACVDPNITSFVFDLTQVEDHIRCGDSTVTIQWFADENLRSPISTPNSFLSAPGDVFAVASDTLQCASAPVTIPLIFAPEIDLSLSITGTPACDNPTGGSIVSTVSGGTPPFSYQWVEVDSTGPNLSGIGSGLYTLIVTDSLGCQRSAEVQMPDVTLLALRCNVEQNVSRVGGSDGVATIAYSNTFVGPATIIIDGPVQDTITGGPGNVDTLRNLPAGSYSVDVIDNGTGCVASCEFTITEPDCANFFVTPSIVDVTCGGGNDGIIRLSVGGATPIVYDWEDDTYDGSATLTDLSAGIYPVTVTDDQGCSDTLQIEVQQPETLQLTCVTTQNETSVGANDGMGELYIENGIAPFILRWMGPTSDTLGLRIADTVSLSDLPSGVYDFELEDRNGCLATCQLIISGPDCSDLSFNTIQSNISCAGTNTGSIEIDISGGNPPYRIDWGIDSLADQTIGRQLPAGFYSISVFDSQGCSFIQRIELTEPDELVINCEVQQNVFTVGGNQGSVQVELSGGTGPYNIALNGPSPANQMASTAGIVDFDNLLAGDYTVILSDANNCQISCQFTITGPDCSGLAVRATRINITCNGETDGSIELFVAGGVEPIDYDWDQNQFDGQSNLTGLAAGIYSVTITDSIGCQDSLSVTISEPTPLIINCNVRNPISAAGVADGSILIEFNGGTAPYNLSWSGAASGFRTLSNIEDVLIDDLAAGTYDFVLTDANGCEQTCSISLGAIDCSTLSLTLDAQNVSCFDANDGQITPIVSGGTAPYIFAWNDDATTDVRTGLGPGSYTLVVTDSLGCFVAETVRITEPTPLQIFCSNAVGVSSNDAADGQIDLQISGGTAPFTINIPALNDTSFTVNAIGNITVLNLAIGNYTVSITDANACQDNCDFNIANVDCSSFSASFSITQPNCPGDDTGIIQVDLTGGTGPYEFDWSDDSFDGLSTLNGLVAGNYSLTVTDNKGCIDIVSANLSAQNEAPRVDIGFGASICQGECVSIDLDMQGEGPFSLQYEIVAGGVAQSNTLNVDGPDSNIEICAEDFAPGTELVNIRFLSLQDANCEALLSENRVVNILQPALGILDTFLCENSSITINNTVYSESNPRGIETFPGAAQNGCDSILEVNLFYVNAPVITDLSTDCNLSNNTYQISFNILGLAPYQITGVSGSVFGSRFVSDPLAADGSVTISVTDDFGCTTEFSIDAPDCTRGGNCIVSAGSLAPFADDYCQFDTLRIATNGDEQLDTNSILLYVIHNGSGNELGEILLSNQTGTFFYQLPLQTNTNYFTAVLVGRNNGFGALDLSDPCLDVTLGAPFQFNDAPRRPRFIQGQDTLCVGQTLTLSTELYPDTSLRYQWITPLGDTITTDSNSIDFPNIGPEMAGIYSVRITNGACSSPVFMPHTFTTIDFPILYAGEDQVSCGIDQAVLLADPISFGVGEWTTSTDAIIINPDRDSTVVRNLAPGINPFIWTVNANECVSQDTVLITYFPTPEVNDDELMLEPGLTRITFDPFVNDRIEGYPLNDSTVQILSQPEVGMIRFLPDDLVFEYTAELSDAEAVAFEYTVCSTVCANGCDTALVIIDLPDVILDVPNGIVRGRANSGLVIGNLEAFPQNEIIITNRWGVVVHRERDYSNTNPWRGRHNGADLPQGTYFMYMKIKDKKDIVKKTIHIIVR